MKLKRLMAASMAGIMAVSSAIVCEISANAVDNMSISHTAADFNEIWSGTTYDEATSTINYISGWAGIGMKYSTPLDLSDYDFLVLKYSASTVEQVLVQVYYDGVAKPVSSESYDESGTIKVQLDSEHKSKVTQIMIQNKNAGTVKIDSLEATVDTDTRVPLNFEYDSAPITLTKQLDKDYATTPPTEVEALKVLIPFNIEGITYKSSTVADLKAKYKSISYSGIKYVSDTLGLKTSDIKMMIYVQTGANWGGWYQSNIVSISSDPQTLSYLVDSISADNSDPVMECGIQFFVEKLDSYDKFADLAIGDTVTLNPGTVAVESVKITDLDGKDVASEYTYGDTINLKANVTPADADGADTVEWASENPTVATVDENGKVTLLKAGEAKITAIAGDVSHSVFFTVNKKKLSPSPTVLDTLTVTDNNVEEAVEKALANFTIRFFDYKTLEDVSLVKGTDFTVSDPQISADKKSYSITIELIGDAADRYELSQTTLEADIAYKLDSIELNHETLNLVAGADGSTLTVETTPDSALLTNLTIAYESSDPTVATVDKNGLVTPVKAGTATITVTATAPVIAGGIQLEIAIKTATCAVTVTDDAIPATNIELDAYDKTMNVGDKAKLTATVKPADTTDKVIWKSSNAKVASVDENGNITALAEGKAEITATAGSVSAVCKVTVKVPQNIEDNTKYPAIPKDYAKIDPVVTTVNSDGTKDMLIMFSISDSDVKNYRGARVTFKREDGKIFSRSLILGKYYTDVTYIKNGDNYNGDSQNYIVIRLRNVQDSWGEISMKFELINGLG